MKTNNLSSQTATKALNFLCILPFIFTISSSTVTLSITQKNTGKKNRSKLFGRLFLLAFITSIEESHRFIYLNAVLFECNWTDRCNPMYSPLSCFFITIKKGKMWISLYSWPEFVLNSWPLVKVFLFVQIGHNGAENWATENLHFLFFF